jgi:hypothetical protein
LLFIEKCRMSLTLLLSTSEGTPMSRITSPSLAAILCVLCTSCADESVTGGPVALLAAIDDVKADERAPSNPAQQEKAAEPENAKANAGPLEGAWFGSWGGGQVGETVFQPVRAYLYVQGDRAGFSGFRKVNRLEGTIRVDTEARWARFLPARDDKEKPLRAVVEFTYELRGNQLTLIDDEGVPIQFERRAASHVSQANVPLELVATAGIDDAGRLLVTRFSELRVDRAGLSFFEPGEQPLDLKQATILLVEEAGAKEIAVDEARRLVGKSALVAIVFRDEEPPRKSDLWNALPAPSPEGAAVRRMYARLLRPGTLVFVLPGRLRVPEA